MARHQTEAALQLYQESLSLNPRWFAGWQSLTLLLLDQKQFREALEAAKKLVDIQPEKGDGWTLLGISEFRLAQDEESFAHLLKASKLPFENPALRSLEEYHFAMVLILRRDFDSAQKILSWHHSHGMQSDELMESLGLAALRIPSRAGQTDPSTRNMALEVGQIQLLIVRKEFDQAQNEFKKLISAHPNIPGPHYAYGNFLAQWGRYDEAFAVFCRELQLLPEDPLILLQLGALAMKQNRREEALGYCRRAMERNPNLFAGHLIQGKILLQQSKINEALAELQSAVQLAPSSYQVHVALMNAYLSAGRNDEAAREKEILRNLDDRETAVMSGIPSGDSPARPKN